MIATVIIITAKPMAMPVIAISTAGREAFLSVSSPLYILLAKKSGKFIDA
jgi:hypothetical protein